MTSDPLPTASALADPARWDAAPPLAGRRVLLQASDLDEVLPGADRWTNATVDMQPAWLRRACERMPVGEDGEPTAAAGPRPEGEVTQAWSRSAPPEEFPSGFTTTEVLHWASGAAGEQAAAAWVADVAAEASRCPGAVVVDALADPGSGGSDGMTADVVIVAVPGNSRAISGSDVSPSWRAYALAAAGPTAWEISTTAAASSAEEAGQAAGALLERTATRVLAADDAVRLSGVDDTALAPFLDPDARPDGPGVPFGAEPGDASVVTETDLEISFPGTGQWWARPQPAIGGGWRLAWCDEGTSLPLTVGAPSERGGPWGPRNEAGTGEAEVASPSPEVHVQVLRWSPEAVGLPGTPAAYAWAEAVRSDVEECSGARTTAVGALPGSGTSAAAVPDGAGWRVVVTTTNDSTAVQLRVRLAQGTAEDADAAATSAAALARRVVANVIRVDAASPDGR